MLLTYRPSLLCFSPCRMVHTPKRRRLKDSCLSCTGTTSLSCLFFFSSSLRPTFFFFIIQPVLISAWEYELQTKSLIQWPTRNKHISTQNTPPFPVAPWNLHPNSSAASQRKSSRQIFISLYICCLIQSHLTIATFIPHSSKTMDWISRKLTLLFLASSMPSLLFFRLWVERCGMALSSSSSSRTLLIWPQIGSENGIRHSWVGCSSGQIGHM